jgi:hypothetical protein
MAHRWRFFRAGGFDQVRLDTGADLAALGSLDPKLWAVLSCPTKGLELDAHTLELLDADRDGRIRVPEVLAATSWVMGLLASPADITRGARTLPLSAIAPSADGAKVLASAKAILKGLGRPDATEISPADTADTVKIFSKMLFNGDGIVPPESAEADAEAAQAIRDIIACLGAEKDMSGLDGVSAAKVKQFFAEARSFLDWWKKSEGDTTVLPLGEDTPVAFDAFRAVSAAVNDYFTRCALAAMDPSAAARLNPPVAMYDTLAGEKLSAASVRLSELPIARIEAGRALPLAEGLNPAWAERIHRLRAACITPILGSRDRLTAEDWDELSRRFAAHAAWMATKPTQSVEKLGHLRLVELLRGSGEAAIMALIARDEAVAGEAKGMAAVDKLAHLHRDLHTFLNNFVALRDFYTKRAKAVFQYGTLFLDDRSCELCLRVDDAGRHAALAGNAMTFLIYCDCVRKGADKMSIVAALTGGDSDFVTVGRNGVFYDRKGNDWDATVTKVVDHPISIRQAFWAPYKRVGKFIGDQIEKFGAERDKASTDEMTAGVSSAAAPDAKAPAPFDVAKFAGIFAAIGLALGSIGTALVAVLTGFLGLAIWQMPLVVAGALFVFSGPSMLLAAMKLRKRNLGPLLDASGWAINARAMLNIPFGGSLTALGTLPPNAERALTDPYAERKRPWMFYTVFAAAVGAAAYVLHREGILARWIERVLRAITGH